MKVYAVIGGIEYQGEDFDSLRLFDCLSTAALYAGELEQQLGVDYVVIEEREIDFTSALSAT